MKKIMDKLKTSGLMPNLITPAFLALILFNTVKITKYLTEIDTRAISTVEMRVRLEDHMESWTPVRQERAFERLRTTELNIASLQTADCIAIIDRQDIKAALKRIESNQITLLKTEY